MRYEEFIRPVTRLPFIGSAEQADAATRTVLGILASRAEPSALSRLSRELPEPLNLERLRGDAQDRDQFIFDAYVFDVAEQFNLSLDEASTVIDAVLDATRATVGDELMREIKTALPPDWEAVMARS